MEAGFLLLAMLTILGVGYALTLRQAARERRRRLEQETARVAAAQARVAERVVALFGQVTDARPGAGRTAAAFAAVERAFQRAAAAYDAACQQAEEVRERAARGDLSGVRQQAAAAIRALEAVHPLLDELEAALRAYRQRWAEAEARIREVRERLAAARRDLAAAAAAGAPDLPVAGQLARMEQFLDQAVVELRKDNPVAALQKAEDVAISLERVESEVSQYRSAAVALQQAREELDALRRTAADRPGAAALLQEAEELLGACAGHLAAGRLDHLEVSLLQVQERLRQVRRLGRADPSGAVH
ncbi:MAG: hypothetical protein DIU70_007180 [Bacillota bacterium]|nr:MAG: hypothetical protein DIU70_10150 [Bacillota bacterium]